MTILHRLKITLLALAFILPFTAAAQWGPDNSDEWDEDPESVPIDGGVGLLVAAGAGYGLKKVRDIRRARQQAHQTPPEQSEQQKSSLMP